MNSAGAPVRRLRWFDIITPQAASLGLSVAAAAAIFGGWAAKTGIAPAQARLQIFLHGFTGLNILLDFSNLVLVGLCLWILSRVTDPALPARFVLPSRRALLTGLVAGIAIVLASGALEYLSDTYLHTQLSRDTLSMPIIPQRPDQMVLGIFTAALLAPLAEEAYFRGIVLGWFARHGGTGWAILGSSLLFAGLHLKLFTPGGTTGLIITAELFLVGAVLALVAVRTGSLWASFVAHGVNNFCAVIASVYFSH